MALSKNQNISCWSLDRREKRIREKRRNKRKEEKKKKKKRRRIEVQERSKVWNTMTFVWNRLFQL